MILAGGGESDSGGKVVLDSSCGDELELGDESDSGGHVFRSRNVPLMFEEVKRMIRIQTERGIFLIFMDV